MNASKTSRTPSRKSDRPRGSASAAGQYLGYSLQVTQMLSLLLQADGQSSVSLEVFEDVGATSAQGKKLARQVKSTLGHNPISNRALDFWKTLSNWVDAIDAGILDPNTSIFEIYVSTKKDGRIAEAFSQSKTDQDAQIALEDAITILKASAPKKADFPKEKAVEKYIEAFLNFEKAKQIALIKNFSLQFGTGASFADIEKSVSKGFVPEEILTDVITYSLGWVKKMADACIEEKLPAIIKVDVFRKEITAFIRKHDRRSVLASFASSPNEEEIKQGLLKKYVRQLDLIESEDADKIQAVTDYLLASNDRIAWSLKGLIQSQSLLEFEKELVRTWGNLKNKVRLAGKDLPEVEKGQLLYSECGLHKSNLEGLETPGHFTPGSFHALADKEEIGWHLNYKKLLVPNKVVS
jgi:ABC-3C protein